jgi:hypothetical protein
LLIVTDINELGDKRLNLEEGLAQLKERNLALAATKKIPNQTFLENQDMALGNPMSPQEFIRRITKVNSDICVQPGGVRGAVAVYYVCMDDDPESPTFGQSRKKYVTGFYVDRMFPEFSAVLPDEMGIAKREIRGWRSSLLALLAVGALTYPQVKAVFGEPKGERGILWQEQTLRYRI